MHKLRLLICYVLLYTILFVPTCYAYLDSGYVWSNYSDTVSTNSSEVSTTPTDLNLESESAILIEQHSRKNFI